MQVVEVQMDDLVDGADRFDLAKAEAESAKQAALVAEKAATEAQGSGMPKDMREEWARLARQAAGLAWAHALRADQFAPNSSIGRAAREHVATAKSQARAAELACRD
jgi:hypothetical protein